ncbi:MAG: hypothetical protein ACE361_00840 [Aureliella sp.]
MNTSKREPVSVARARRRCKNRRAVTLLELVVSSAMLAIVGTSLSVVLRTARTTWEASDRDYGSLHHAHTIARHFVRQAREAREVTNIAANQRSITLQMQDGEQLTWSYTTGTTGGYDDAVFVTYHSTGTQSPLAYGIRELSFTGFDANRNETSVVDDIQTVQILVSVQLSSKATPQTVASTVWIRSW